MVSHMKITLLIDDKVMQRLKQEASRQRRTISELVEAALRQLLDGQPQGRRKLPALSPFDGGSAYVDVANRDALYQAMEGR